MPKATFTPSRARDINAFPRSIAGASISLKDFRTLCATARVLDRLARTAPADSRRQVLDAIREAAADLANTPAICRKSYVHDTVLDAFETGTLERYAAGLNARGPARPERLMARVLAAHCAQAAAVRNPRSTSRLMTRRNCRTNTARTG